MNPKTKVYINGILQTQHRSASTGRFTSFRSSLRTKLATAWHYTKITAAVFIINAAIVAAATVAFSTTTVTASTETITLPLQTPVLDRIADCESGNGTANSASQYAPSGQLLISPNTNGTVDIGKYQINSVWFKQATAMHLDLTKEADNKAMAEWIYANKGTGDWSSSSHCWNK